MTDLQARRRWFRLAQISAACALVAGCGGASGPAGDLPAAAGGDATSAAPAAPVVVDSTPTPTVDLPGDVATVPETDVGDTSRDLRALGALPAPVPAITMVEANDAVVGGGARVLSASNATTGTSVGWMHVQGAFMEFKVDGGAGGEHRLSIRHSNGNISARNLSLYVNGTKVRQLRLANTGGWNRFIERTSTTVTLKAGQNVVRLQRDADDRPSADIDRLSF